jgi:hypothetical protein
MPWMICKCGKRFYASPSMMNDARCEECAKVDERPATVSLDTTRDYTDWKPDPTAGSTDGETP